MKKLSKKDIDSAIRSIREVASPSEVDLSSFKPKDELNADIWINDRISQKVRKHLLVIARDFIEFMDFDDMTVEDITFTGSLANYNWNKDFSDVDLHIIVDIDRLKAPRKILDKFFDAMKKAWNDRHGDISIYGYPVEVYVQDSKAYHASSGVYSLMYDKWLTKPNPDAISDKDLDKKDVRQRAFKFMTRIDACRGRLAKAAVFDDYQAVYDEAGIIFKEIKATRQSGMGSRRPEMSEGNIIFKALRRNGYIEKIVDIRAAAYDKMRSLTE